MCTFKPGCRGNPHTKAMAIAVVLIAALTGIDGASAASPIVISSFSPTSAAPGETVVIRGSGFDQTYWNPANSTGLRRTAIAAVVTFGNPRGSAAQVVRYSPAEISVVVPAGARRGSVYIVNGLSLATGPTILAQLAGYVNPVEPGVIEFRNGAQYPVRWMQINGIDVQLPVNGVAPGQTIPIAQPPGTATLNCLLAYDAGPPMRWSMPLHASLQVDAGLTIAYELPPLRPLDVLTNGQPWCDWNAVFWDPVMQRMRTATYRFYSQPHWGCSCGYPRGCLFEYFVTDNPNSPASFGWDPMFGPFSNNAAAITFDIELRWVGIPQLTTRANDGFTSLIAPELSHANQLPTYQMLLFKRQ